MTEQQKRTAGLAIASFVCGCFFIIPILGFLLCLPAIIMGIIALIKISNNKETLKGKGFAIAGIVLGGISIILIPLIAMLAAIAIPNLLRAKVSANDALAQSTLRSLSTAAETYATANQGDYPWTVLNLTDANPPYINSNSCEQTISGYHYNCEFNSEGYYITATPEEVGATGTAVQTIETGGILFP